MLYKENPSEQFNNQKLKQKHQKMFKTITIAAIATFTNAVNRAEDDGLITDTRYISMNTDALFKQYDFNADAKLGKKKGEWRKAYAMVMKLNGSPVPKKEVKPRAEKWL